ncbi:uncharacterized protein LOC126852820 [Cataglyphis hispanica]|uniref:uncharacterized protein LOC126852820 n=1 Tax=Cataglyphis hispanica TaxID=1086592 RepID=UPI0021806F06|nr:uncharacterized protein LOC126852820 [Cataglyphis hispanica]
MVKNNKRVDFIIRDLNINSSYKPEEKLSSSSIINNAIICDPKVVDRIKQRIIDTIVSTSEDFEKAWHENLPSIVKDFVHDVSLRHADYVNNILPKPTICNPQCVSTRNFLHKITRFFDALISAKREKTKDSSSHVTLAEDKIEEEIFEKSKSIIYTEEKPSTIMMEAVQSATIIIQRKTFVDSQVSVSSIHFVQESQYPLTSLDVTGELRKTVRIQVSSLIKEPSRDEIAYKVSSINLKPEKCDFQDAAVITGLAAIAVKRETVEEEERRKDSTIFFRSILDTVTFAVFQHIAIISTKDAKVVKDKKDEEKKDVQVVKVPKVAKIDKKKKEETDVKFAINDEKEEKEKYIKVAKDHIKEEEEKYIEAAKVYLKEEEEEYIKVAKDDIKEEEEEHIKVAKDDIKEEKKKYIKVAKDHIKEEEEKYIEAAKVYLKEEEEEYIEAAKNNIREEEEEHIKVAKDDIKEEKKKYIKVAKDHIKEEEEKYIEAAKDNIKEEKKKYIKVAKDDIKEEEEKYIGVAKNDIKEKKNAYVVFDDTTIETTVDDSIIDTIHKRKKYNNKIVSYKKPKYRSIDSLDFNRYDDISETLIKNDYFITKKEKMPLYKKIQHLSVSTFFSCTSFEPIRKFCCEILETKICLEDRSSLLRILQPISCLIPSNIYLRKYSDIPITSFDPQIAATQETTLSNILHPSPQNSRTIGYHVSGIELTNNKNAFLRHNNINCCRKHRAIHENSSYAPYDTHCKFGVKYCCPHLNNIGNIQTGYYHCNNNYSIRNTRHCERNQLHYWSRENLYFIHPCTSRHSLRYY